jgi:hypothetical protein
MARRCDQHSLTDACKRQGPLHKRSNLALNLPNQLSASGWLQPNAPPRLSSATSLELTLQNG